MTKEQCIALVHNLQGWHQECKKEDISQPELMFLARSLRQGHQNFYGDPL